MRPACHCEHHSTDQTEATSTMRFGNGSIRSFVHADRAFLATKHREQAGGRFQPTRE
jgi:hypothetical protein